MPSPYRRDLARLKAEIVARIRAGEVQRAVCASPGMPGAHTVRNWAKGDPLFAAELLAARRVGTWRRHWAFDEAVAAVFLARARAGETINSLIGQPGMPSRKTYTHWNRTQAAFQEATFALRQRRDAGIGAQGAARRRGFDPGLADRLIVALHRAPPLGFPGARLEEVLAADPELPCRPTLRRWRRDEPMFDRVLRMIFAARRAAGPRVHDLLADEIVDHIVYGGSFASYSRYPAGPARATLRRWYRADAGFAAAVDQACERREALLDVQLWIAAESVPPGPIREMNQAVAPLTRAIARLRHRPGAVHRPRLRGDERGAGPEAEPEAR